MDAFRPFRPEDPIREAIEFCGNSLTSLFSPLSTAAITEERRQLNFPITKSSRSIGKLRQYHRRHRWADADCAAAFEQHFIYRAPKLTLRNVVENIQATINYDSDPANYVVAGAIQAFSPIQYNANIEEKALLPFHKQAKLSELKKAMKHGHSYFE
eukprot:gene26225-34847_t